MSLIPKVGGKMQALLSTFDLEGKNCLVTINHSSYKHHVFFTPNIKFPLIISGKIKGNNQVYQK